MNSTSLPMTSRDVEDCYTLFLGRAPEAEAVASYTNVEPGVVLGDLLERDDFREGVLTPLLLRRPLPQENVAATPPFRLIDWAQRNLPLELVSRTRAGAARTWVHLLELLLSDCTLVALAKGLSAAGIDQLLRDRLDKSPLAAATRSVVGAIDAASALEIRGWAVDLCDKSVPVRVEIYADNLFVGAALCSESRPDVKESVGRRGSVRVYLSNPDRTTVQLRGRKVFVGHRCRIARAYWREYVGARRSHAEFRCFEHHS